MDYALLHVVFFTGLMTGIVFWDLRQRRRDRLSIEAHQRDVQAAAKKLSDTHNNLIIEMKNIGDKVNTHEFALRQKFGDDSNISGKRF